MRQTSSLRGPWHICHSHCVPDQAWEGVMIATVWATVPSRPRRIVMNAALLSERNT